MTDRRPAAATRVLLAGVSTAATLGLVAVMGAQRPNPGAPPEVALLRVVITDPRIDPNAAVDAARDGARTGQAVVRVPVAAAPRPATAGGSGAAHTRTASS